MIKRGVHRPETLLVATFAALVAAGTIALSLPAAQARPVSVLDALFTATSAVCVTGLITVDTATEWTRFGQTVILVLIQLGGLGIMTFGALTAEVLGVRLSFTSDVAWRSAFFDVQARGNFRRAVGGIVRMTLVCEAVGAVLLYVGMRSLAEPVGGVYDAVFLSVSAFCNAGFSVYSDNVMALNESVLALSTLMGLIFLGGLGYVVLFETLERARGRITGRPARSVRWSLHSRIVWRISATLVLVGALALLVLGLGDTDRAGGHRLMHVLFQSVTARTAGFNTVDIGGLPMASLLIVIALMFVGGSPGSCAGGVKTTTATVWLARVWTRLKAREGVSLWGRELPHDVVRRAALVLAVAVLWNLAGILILTVTEQGNPALRFEQVLFEQVSAFGTVGLSAGLTPHLSALGKLWIVASMFAGRVGPLTLALAVLTAPRTLVRYPAERVMIG